MGWVELIDRWMGERMGRQLGEWDWYIFDSTIQDVVLSFTAYCLSL